MAARMTRRGGLHFPLDPRLKGVVFDLDGTLVSTRQLIAHCVKEVVGKYLDRTPTLEEVMANFGPAAWEIVSKYTLSLGEMQNRRAIEDYYDCYRRELPRRALLFPGIRELLGKLRKSGRRLAVFTGIERIQMDMTLEGFGLRKYFQVLIARDDVQRPKPDPEGVKLALAKLGVRPEESLMVGDSPSDILAGKQAGVVTAAALWSRQFTTGDPSEAGPDYSFHSIRELSDFLFPQRRKNPASISPEDLR
jgi:pyrophosphatase PpaX